MGIKEILKDIDNLFKQNAKFRAIQIQNEKKIQEKMQKIMQSHPA